MIEHEELCSLIPHAGSMCLLETVEKWDEANIVCTSGSHRAASNPLRSGGQLTALHGVEYAAQAMAVHGGLQARERGESNPPGFLAALRDVKLYVERLDTVDGMLRIEASELMRSGGSFIYEFRIEANGRILLEGRLTVMVQEEV